MLNMVNHMLNLTGFDSGFVSHILIGEADSWKVSTFPTYVLQVNPVEQRRQAAFLSKGYYTKLPKHTEESFAKVAVQATLLCSIYYQNLLNYGI